MPHNHLGFFLNDARIVGNVLIPRYYNPEIKRRLDELRDTDDLLVLGDLVERGLISVSTGDEIGKMAYGTGPIPFVRTSDISNWEIKVDPKQGVSEEMYEQYARGQDVKPGDILFVRDGTYLIGQACLVTDEDSKILYQSHLLKFRVSPDCPVSSGLLLAILSCPVARRQIRAKQFTADIIDTLGNRYMELILPVPKDTLLKTKIGDEVMSVVRERVRLRERLRRIPLYLEGLISNVEADSPQNVEADSEQRGNPGFMISSSVIRSDVFVPRYYDPRIDERLKELSRTHDLITLGHLLDEKLISSDTGIEVGKMAYGTGAIPFIRTSDISNWELKADPKQLVSVDLYEQWKIAQDVTPEDIFVVRDGTYLVGTSCILTEHDTRILYCGGLYKLRVLEKRKLDPYLLLALLNCPIVRRQMRSKQFTRDVIDTLGKRLFEVVLPILKSKKLRETVANETRDTILARVKLRNRTMQIPLEVEGTARMLEPQMRFLSGR